MDKHLRGTATDAFQRLQLPARVTLDSLVEHVEAVRNRRIVIIESEKLTGKKICGLWIPREHVDVVYHSVTRGMLHRQQMILHELSHMILRHDEAEGATWQGIKVFQELRLWPAVISARIWRPQRNTLPISSPPRLGNPARRYSALRTTSND